MSKNLNKFNLNGKCALITGGAGLLGIEHADALLEVGAKVVLTDINLESLNEAKLNLSKKYSSSFIDVMLMDVTNIDSMRKVSNQITISGSSVDILINNAAIDPKVKKDHSFSETSRFENFMLDQWNLEILVGLTGAFLASQIFGTLMAERNSGGVILNIASDLSVISPDQRLYQKEELTADLQPVKPVTYSVIKTGLIGLTRYLSTYWANKNIRCNALSPGGIFNNQDEAFVKKIENLIPLKRMAKKDEYRGAIQFLCSDASSYMTGQNLIIDGGRSVW